MKKWPVTLSTTDPGNFIGIVGVRQGNKNSEILEATIIENGLPKDLSGMRITFQTKINNYLVERNGSIIDAKKGIVQYVFDDYTMQSVGSHIANFTFYKNDDFIDTTQNFKYTVLRAVSKTSGEMGSYWQTVEELMKDLADFINSTKSDIEKWQNYYFEMMQSLKNEIEIFIQNSQNEFLSWFESIKDVLESIDPGGVLLSEIINSRTNSRGTTFNSLRERMDADYWELYSIKATSLSNLVTLHDDRFSFNHEVKKLDTIQTSTLKGSIVIATIDDPNQDTFYLEKVGEIDVQ